MRLDIGQLLPQAAVGGGFFRREANIHQTLVMSGHEQGLVNIRFSPEKTASNCCLREHLANVEPHAAPRAPSASLPRCEISILYRGAGHLPPIAPVISV